MLQRANIVSGLGLTVLLLAHSSLGRGIANYTNRTTKHSGKVLNVFNVVTFKNDFCTSTFDQNGLFRGGTCYSSSECQERGGLAAGQCAAGYGVCCVFIYTDSGSSLSQNCSYIQSPGFPSSLVSGSSASATASLTYSYTISKCAKNICDFRLDLNAFSLKGPATSDQGVCSDSMKVTVAGSTIPTICGSNAGQHMYIDVSTAETATITFSVSSRTSDFPRTWDIKVSQIPCATNYTPPKGCLQYFTSLNGKYTTFNYVGTGNDLLAGQSYTACIRRAEGFCCSWYTTCDGTPASFTLPTSMTAAGVTGGQQDNMCINNVLVAYLQIPGGYPRCGASSDNIYRRSSYCGTGLSYAAADTRLPTPTTPICACDPSFSLTLYTTSKVATPAAGVPNAVGACITWMQVPCNS